MISKFKIKVIICFVFLLLQLYPILYTLYPAYADATIDKGIDFLKSKQDSEGKITGGFSAPSQWSAIAFTANDMDISSIKNPTTSLKDFLLIDVPINNSATEWESRILAIVAIGENPTNFGGVNYLQNLETFYENNQIGDICSLNDDIFGLLALVASGDLSNAQIKQDVLNFIIDKQDPTDGGFGWSAPSCTWYSTSSDMTAAAIQALQIAKDNNLTHANLDDSITKAQNYLLANQNSDGGFGYFGSSDADTTGWAIMALNVLGIKDSTQAVSAKNWLTNTQQADGGFLSWGGTDSTTTSQTLTALAGKSWVLKVFTSPLTPSPTPSHTPSPVITPSPTPLPTLTPQLSPSPTPTPVVTPTPTLQPSPTPQPTPSPTLEPIITIISQTPSPEPQQEILGIQNSNNSQLEILDTKQAPGRKHIFLLTLSLLSFTTAFMYWKRIS